MAGERRSGGALAAHSLCTTLESQPVSVRSRAALAAALFSVAPPLPPGRDAFRQAASVLTELGPSL